LLRRTTPSFRNVERRARCEIDGFRRAASRIEESSALPFVGLDCVEVTPVHDQQELTSLAAAQIVWNWLSGRVKAIRNRHISRRGNRPARYTLSGEKIVAKARGPCDAEVNP
jgi:hypothetical protein